MGNTLFPFISLALLVPELTTHRPALSFRCTYCLRFHDQDGGEGSRSALPSLPLWIYVHEEMANTVNKGTVGRGCGAGRAGEVGGAADGPGYMHYKMHCRGKGHPGLAVKTYATFVGAILNGRNDRPKVLFFR